MDTQKNIMASIVAILTNNGLTELSLGDYDELHDPAYIVWFDDDGSPYDDPVIKVMVEDNTVSVEVEAREFANNVTLQDYEINRPEWWRQRAGGTGKGRQTPLSRLWQNTQGPTEILFGTLPETCRAQTDSTRSG